jgi:hypothetical protein
MAAFFQIFSKTATIPRPPPRQKKTTPYFPFG